MATYPESTLIFENPEFTVRALSVSDMDNSVYLITIRHTGEQMLIDPAYDAEALYTFTLEAIMQDCPNLALTEENDRRVRILESEEDFEPIPRRALGVTGIMVTHGHWDHIRAQENFTVENELNGGEVFDFYDTELQVRAISVPGHTPGSIVYSVQTTWEDDSPATLLFTGDALFPGGVGKTDSPAQFGELFSNVLEKLFGNFDDEAIVLPGHGRSTTLGTERPHLEEWGSRGW